MKRKHTPPTQNTGHASLIITSPTTQLSKEETTCLKECELLISKHLKTFFEVGAALLRIRDNQLYRSEYDTFEAYCRGKWGFGKSHAYRLLNGAEIIHLLGPVTEVLPENERQVRPLAGLPPQKLLKAWETAVNLAGTAPITEKVVREAVSTVQHKTKSRTDSLGKEHWQTELKKLLRKAGKALEANDRMELVRLIEKMSLAINVGNGALYEEFDK